MEQCRARFRAPSDLTWPSDWDSPRCTLDFAANLNRVAKIQAANSFDPQTAATEVHYGSFAAIDQEFCWGLVGA